MSGAGPVRVTSPWRRGRARRKLQRGVRDLAAKATRERATAWRVQPIVEVCTDAHYTAWRNARERAWKRDGGKFSTRTWPERLIPGEWGGVLLPQSHGGHYRGQPTRSRRPSSRTPSRQRTRCRAALRPAGARSPRRLDAPSTQRSQRRARRAARTAARGPHRPLTETSHPARAGVSNGRYLQASRTSALRADSNWGSLMQ